VKSDYWARAARVLRSWREERGILRFIDEQFHATPDPWQEETVLEFADPRSERKRISMQACTGPGKTAVESWCAWWFMATQGDQYAHPKGLATSITGDNLKGNLWAELAKWQGVSEFLSEVFVWTATSIFCKDHPATWRLEARTWPKTANAEVQGQTFSGLHSPFPFVIIDESGGIPTTVLRAAEQALSTCIFGRILQGGNPISLEGMLHAAAHELRDQWKIVKVTGDPDDPKAWVYSKRVGPGPLAWAKLQIKQYGRDNPWVQAYILGKFPPAAINALLSAEDVEIAMARRIRPENYSFSQKRLGVDVARFGDDRSVIFPRQGMASFKPAVMRTARTTDIAARAANAFVKWNAELILVDDTGHWGHGVIDNLITGGYPAIGVQFNDKALNVRYFNRRAEMWIEMAKQVKAGLMLPDIPELAAELYTPTYTFHQGKFLLEEKEQIKARLGRSPDLADALALTFALPDMPSDAIAQIRGERSGGRGVGKVLTDYEPFAERGEP
jgi:hypothetical protein